MEWSVKPVKIESVLKDLKEAMDLVNQDPEFNNVPISSVEIVLKVNASAEAGVGFDIPLWDVIKARIVGRVNHVTETRIEFVPSRPGTLKKLKPTAPVIAIKEAIVAARVITPGLKFKSATAQIDFTVSQEGELSFVFWGKEAVEATHSIILNFGEKEK